MYFIRKWLNVGDYILNKYQLFERHKQNHLKLYKYSKQKKTIY